MIPIKYITLDIKYNCGFKCFKHYNKICKEYMFKCLKIAKNSSSKLLVHLNPQIKFFSNGNMNIQQNIVWVFRFSMWEEIYKFCCQISSVWYA